MKNLKLTNELIGVKKKKSSKISYYGYEIIKRMKLVVCSRSPGADELFIQT